MYLVTFTIPYKMKKLLLIIGVIFCAQISFAQEKSAFQDGEWFKFKMSYSGWLKAGEATLKINEKQLNGKPVYHVVGKGKTTGLINAVFKVRDRYESYFDRETGTPYKFIRKIDEGGHTKDIEIDFDHAEQVAVVNNKKHKKIQLLRPRKMCRIWYLCITTCVII